MLMIMVFRFFPFKLAGAGAGAALSGKWAMRVGMKKAMLAGGFAYCLGFGVAAAGIANHCLPLVYAGNRKSIACYFSP